MRRLLLVWLVAVLLGGTVPVLAMPEIEQRAMPGFQRGEALRAAKDETGAVEAYRKALAIFPAHPTAFERLREVYNQSGRTVVETIAELEARVAREERDFVSWNLLGVLYGRERRWGDALDAFARSLRAEPRAADALVNQGWVLVTLRRYDDAIAAYEAALALQPRLARAYAGLGSALVEARGDYDEAMRHYLTAVKLEPENAALLNDVGWLSYKMSRYPEAVAALETAAALDPNNPMIHTNLGLAYQQAGQLDEALAHHQRALAINPEYTLALYGLGKAYESGKQYPEAVKAYRRAWNQSGNDIYLLLWLQAYMAGHGQIIILFLFGFLAVGGVIAFRMLRARRTLAATKG